MWFCLFNLVQLPTESTCQASRSAQNHTKSLSVSFMVQGATIPRTTPRRSVEICVCYDAWGSLLLFVFFSLSLSLFFSLSLSPSLCTEVQFLTRSLGSGSGVYIYIYIKSIYLLVMWFGSGKKTRTLHSKTGGLRLQSVISLQFASSFHANPEMLTIVIVG